MSRSTFKILFYVKKGSERANGYLPLMCRLTVDGEIKQFSCKLDVPPKLWDVKTARATGKSAEAQKINAEVDRIRVDVNRRYQELMQSDGYVTAARLRDVYLGLGVKRETLLKLFEQHNEEFIKKALELHADVLLVSQTVTQKDVHIQNLTNLIELLEAEGLRDKFVVCCGGPRITHELAKELGYDAGFGAGKYADDVASFAVTEMVKRGIFLTSHHNHFLNASLTDEDIAHTVDVAEDAFNTLRKNHPELA